MAARRRRRSSSCGGVHRHQRQVHGVDRGPRRVDRVSGRGRGSGSDRGRDPRTWNDRPPAHRLGVGTRRPQRSVPGARRAARRRRSISLGLSRRASLRGAMRLEAPTSEDAIWSAQRSIESQSRQSPSGMNRRVITRSRRLRSLPSIASRSRAPAKTRWSRALSSSRSWPASLGLGRFGAHGGVAQRSRAEQPDRPLAERRSLVPGELGDRLLPMSGVHAAAEDERVGRWFAGDLLRRHGAGVEPSLLRGGERCDRRSAWSLRAGSHR